MFVSSSIVSQCVAIQHDATLSEHVLMRALKGMGFEIYSVMKDGDAPAIGGVPTERKAWKSWW